MGRKYIKIGKKTTTGVAKKKLYTVESRSYNYEVEQGRDDSKSFESYEEAKEYIRNEMREVENTWTGVDVDSGIGTNECFVEVYDPTWGYDQLFYGTYWWIKDAETGTIISPLSRLK